MDTIVLFWIKTKCLTLLVLLIQDYSPSHSGATLLTGKDYNCINNGLKVASSKCQYKLWTVLVFIQPCRLEYRLVILICFSYTFLLGTTLHNYLNNNNSQHFQGYTTSTPDDIESKSLGRAKGSNKVVETILSMHAIAFFPRL